MFSRDPEDHDTVSIRIGAFDGDPGALVQVLGAVACLTAEHVHGIHKDITSYGGWRAYRASPAQPDEA